MRDFRVDDKIEYLRHKDKERKKFVEADVVKINQILDLPDKERDTDVLKSLHMEIDGKYQVCIADWGRSMYSYNNEYGFDYGMLSEKSLIHNLNIMKSKLESFSLGINDTTHLTANAYKPSDVNVTVNNSVNISVSFDEARQRIEDMSALSREQTDEILNKINELEKIQNEKISKKSKWEKIKPIIAFIMDKGADVGIAILSLIIQMNLS